MQEDTFYIVLTIPGTQYKEVEVVVKQPFRPIHELIRQIVRFFKLPRMNNDGKPVEYLLGRPKEDGEVELFEYPEGRYCFLRDFKVYSGEHLHLLARPVTGGGGRNTEYMMDGCERDSGSDAKMIERELRCERDRLEQLAQERERLERERERLVQERINLMHEREVLKEEIKFLERKKESLEREREEFERERRRERERMEQLARECAIEVEREQEKDNEEATTVLMKTQQKEKSWLGRKLLERLNILRQKVYGSIFAPAEIRPLSHMLIQVYLHLYEETEKVKELAKEPQKEAERRDFIPLECELKKGDKVDVLLTIFGKKLLMSEKKSLVWQGSFTKCSFDYLVPNSDEVNELSCIAMLSVNGIPVGEMSFVTSVVDFPRDLTPEVISHNYHKVFISYAHKDLSKVKRFHEGLKKHKIEHFFDRDTLVTGDIFPLEIKEYIDTADLFVLFWSRNAAESDYVQLELNQALERTYPKVQPPSDAKLRIYPYSIEPRADYPERMQPYYHFGEL